MTVKSTLPNGDFYVHLAVMLDLVVLFCVLMLISSNIVPQFGFSVKMSESDFLMDNTPGQKHIVAVTSGENPVVFLGNNRLEGGLQGLARELDRIVNEAGDEDLGRIGIIFVLDEAVSRSTEQALIDMVLSRNMICSIASEPRD